MKSMKQLAIALTLVAVAMPAGRVLAGPIGDGQFNHIQGPGVGAGGHASGSGGEFRVSGYGTSLNNTGYAAATSNQGLLNSFQTFCLEASENTGADPTYFAFNNAAVGGGGGATGGSDPISFGTAWLYSQFALGTLSGYSYTPGNTGGTDRHESAAALQQAIWYLEGETTGVYNSFVTLAEGQFANAYADATPGYAGVMVLNTYSTKDPVTGELGGTKRQDFLYRVPDGGATLALLGGALMALGAARRRFAK